MCSIDFKLTNYETFIFEILKRTAQVVLVIYACAGNTYKQFYNWIDKLCLKKKYIAPGSHFSIHF